MKIAKSSDPFVHFSIRCTYHPAREANLIIKAFIRNTAKLAPNEKLTSDRESRGKRES